MSWDAGFSRAELALLRPLKSPARVQDFLNELSTNFELDGDTCRSPRRVLETGEAHCVEGAILAAAALRLAGRRALLMELLTTAEDDPHVVALFQERGHWGAVGKTNHAVLRYRDAVYRSTRELAMSFFHEYFLNSSGEKTLRSITRPLDLARFDARGWAVAEQDVDYIPTALEDAAHYPLVEARQIRHLRAADPIEIEAGKLVVERAPAKHASPPGA